MIPVASAPTVVQAAGTIRPVGGQMLFVTGPTSNVMIPRPALSQDGTGK